MLYEIFIFLLLIVRVKLSVVIQEEFYEFGITVRPAEVGRFVERTDAFHILRRKREIEYIQILFHTLDMRSFRNGNNTALYQVTQGDLCAVLPYFSARPTITG